MKTMEQEKTFEVEVKKIFVFHGMKKPFYTTITLDVEWTARFLLWCLSAGTKSMNFPDLVEGNLELMKTLVNLGWGEGLFQFVESLQEDLVDYFDDEISEEANNDEDFKQECYEKFADEDDVEEFGYDYQAWWDDVTA